MEFRLLHYGELNGPRNWARVESPAEPSFIHQTWYHASYSTQIFFSVNRSRSSPLYWRHRRHAFHTEVKFPFINSSHRTAFNDLSQLSPYVYTETHIYARTHARIVLLPSTLQQYILSCFAITTLSGLFNSVFPFRTMASTCCYE
jgi:hypothetical protein